MVKKAIVGVMMLMVFAVSIFAANPSVVSVQKSTISAHPTLGMVLTLVVTGTDFGQTPTTFWYQGGDRDVTKAYHATAMAAISNGKTVEITWVAGNLITSIALVN